MIFYTGFSAENFLPAWGCGHIDQRQLEDAAGAAGLHEEIADGAAHYVSFDKSPVHLVSLPYQVLVGLGVHCQVQPRTV